MTRHDFQSRADPPFGYSLLELMTVISLIGVLAAIAIPNFIGFKEKARVTLAITDMKLIEREITLFQNDTGQLPNSLADVNMGAIQDPWDRPYQYLRIDGGLPSSMGQRRKDMFIVPINTDFDLYSLGPDGASLPPFTAQASRDDIVRANNGAYYGKASEF